MKSATINALTAQFPLVEDLIALKETTWLNPKTTTLAEGLPYVGLTKADVDDAHARLNRFAPYLAKAFPETAATKGIIESELVAIPAMQARLEKESGKSVPGTLLLKKTVTCRSPARLKRAAAFMRCWPTRRSWRWKPGC